MKRKRKISGIIIAITSVILFITYLSYVFYNDQSIKKNEPVTKVSSIDFLSIDSIKNDAYKRYQLQIDNLNQNLLKCNNDKKIMSDKMDSLIFKLQKDYDSILIKLDYYKQRLKELNQSKKDTMKVQ
mgnify:CR=1 FL=1